MPLTKRFKRHDSGSTAVEFGLLAIPFFGCMFAIIEIALIFFAGQVLETAVGDASRFILTGQSALPTLTLQTFTDKICTNSIKTLFTCANIKADVRKVSSFAGGNFGMPLDPVTHMLDTTGFTYTNTAPCDIVVVRVIYEWPTFMRGLGLDMASNASPGGKHILMSTAAFRNEPYIGSSCS